MRLGLFSHLFSDLTNLSSFTYSQQKDGGESRYSFISKYCRLKGVDTQNKTIYVEDLIARAHTFLWTLD